MTQPKYRTPEYRQEKLRLTPIILAHGHPCLEPTGCRRGGWITAGTGPTNWHLAHNGPHIAGPAHAYCNLAAGAEQAQKNQGTTPNQRNRWTL